MTRDELIARLKGYEWDDFECKKAQREVSKDAYTSVSAFANTAGGWLLFGISEERGKLEVTGVDDDALDRVQNDFLSTLRGGQKFNRIITVDPHLYEIDGKSILAFYIPESPRHEKPIYLKGNPRDSYIRRAAGDERVTDMELQRLLRDSALQAWDSQPMLEFDAQKCIDAETLDWYQAQFYRRSPEQRHIDEHVEFLREWNFLVDVDGRPTMTRAAVLLFGSERCVRHLLPRPVLDYQRIDTCFEDWSANERWHDRVVFEENLFKTWRGLIAKYTRIAEHPFQLDPATMRRTDDPPDYVAFREAAINLLIHQDYGDHNRKASLKWFTDRTAFWNPGNAFASREQLLDSTEKEIRNPLLVNAFRRIGLSDQAGTGIRAIYRNWHELGHRPPVIVNDKAGKSFEIVLHKEPLITETMQRFQAGLGVKLSADQAEILALALEQPHVSVVDAGLVAGGNMRVAHDALVYLANQKLLDALNDDSYSLAEVIRARLESFTNGKSLEGSDERGRDQVGTRSGLSRDQVEILCNCLKEKAISELMQGAGRTNRSKFRDQVLKPLLNQGLLKMTIPRKPTSSKQKYITTEFGKEFLKERQ